MRIVIMTLCVLSCWAVTQGQMKIDLSPAFLQGEVIVDQEFAQELVSDQDLAQSLQTADDLLDTPDIQMDSENNIESQNLDLLYIPQVTDGDSNLEVNTDSTEQTLNDIQDVVLAAN